MNNSTELQHLKQRRSQLVAMKDKLVAELRGVNGRLKLPAQQHVRQMDVKRQSELVALASEADKEFIAVNTRMKELNLIVSNGVKPAVPLEASESGSMPIRDLAQLRDSYREFSADKTRVGSMRAMAAQFALELTPIIRGLINGKTQP